MRFLFCLNISEKKYLNEILSRIVSQKTPHAHSLQNVCESWQFWTKKPYSTKCFDSSCIHVVCDVDDNDFQKGHWEVFFSLKSNVSSLEVRLFHRFLFLLVELKILCIPLPGHAMPPQSSLPLCISCMDKLSCHSHTHTHTSFTYPWLSWLMRWYDSNGKKRFSPMFTVCVKPWPSFFYYKIHLDCV